MKVKMVPHLNRIGDGESGIHTVIRHYFRILPEYGVELVDDKSNDYDIAHSHAGNTMGILPGSPLITSLHGLYWTAEYDAPKWEWGVNAKLVDCIRASRAVTVPSEWVNETLKRDMHLSADVIPHGIVWEDWQHNYGDEGYIIAYAKNRAWSDVSIPTIARDLARRMPDSTFVSTFSAGENLPNLRVTGTMPHAQMKRMVQGASLFVSPVKETFGIAALEAMAAGVPVLTVDAGQVPELVGHGVAGYCYRPGDIEDVINGVNYCLKHRKTLSDNARALARKWTWEAAAEKLVAVYQRVMDGGDGSIGVVIPVYNKEIAKVERAIDSVLRQTRPAERVVVVDDGSDDHQSYKILCREKGVEYIRQENRGVAHARNAGIAALDTEYVCCLDADDEIEQAFLATCANELDQDSSVYIAYTGITTVQGGSTSQSKWPGEYNYDQFLRRKNQVPTCCVYRRVMWERLGGYRQRYAPTGAGSEDAEFFLRAGAYGYRGKKVTKRGLFRYTLGEGHTAKEGYREVDWLSWHAPWLDNKHPLASHATPPNNKLSHPIRSYDEPTISVIIPVGPGHEEYLWDALDSLEGQTMLEWEAVVVWDAGGEVPGRLKKAFPFVRWIEQSGHTHGPGAARNLGVDYSRAPFIVFLDADDWLYPGFLAETLSAWRNGEEDAVIYTDYAGVIRVPEGHELINRDSKRKINSIGELNFLSYKAEDFDCERAIIQPVGDNPYHWCSVTCLLPKKWHYDIGGFDESMETWEDVDYWWRMARNGKCFTRVPQRLFAYRLDGGKRRDEGLHKRQQLLESLRSKYEQLDKGDAMCGCSKPVSRSSTLNGVTNGHGGISSMAEMSSMNDEDLVMVEYTSTNVGQHSVKGRATSKFYGYRSGGERFLVHREDIAMQPHLFRPVETRVKAEPAPVVEKAPPAAPTPVDVDEDALGEEYPEDEDAVPASIPIAPTEKINFEALGIQGRAVNSLRDAGVTTYADVMGLGTGREDVVGRLTQIKYVGQATANSIYEAVMSI